MEENGDSSGYRTNSHMTNWKFDSPLYGLVEWAHPRFGNQITAVRNLSSDQLYLYMRGTDADAYTALIPNGDGIPSWTDMTGTFKGSSSAAWNTSHLDAYGVGQDESVYVAPDSAPGTWIRPALDDVKSALSTVENVTVTGHPNGTRTDLFIRGTDGTVRHACFGTGCLSGTTWENLGGHILGAPTGSWRGDGSGLDVFVIGTDHHPWVVTWLRSTGLWAWSASALLGTVLPMASEQIGIARNPDGIRLDLFVIGPGGTAYWNYMIDGLTLQGSWQSLGGSWVGAPTASWNHAGSRLDVFALSVDNHPYAKYLQTVWKPGTLTWGSQLPGTSWS